MPALEPLLEHPPSTIAANASVNVAASCGFPFPQFTRLMSHGGRCASKNRSS
jgi:hypothetical protein